MPDNNKENPGTFEKVHEFIGKVKEYKLETVYNKNSQYHGNQYLRLSVELDDPKIKELLLFKEKSENIWKDIEERNYLGKKYLFKLQRRPGAGHFFRLLDWKIIKNGKKK